jgi:hypothetical protein
MLLIFVIQDEIQSVIDRVAEQFLSATKGNLTKFPDIRSEFLRSVTLPENLVDQVNPVSEPKWLNVTGLFDERSSTFISVFEDILRNFTATKEDDLSKKPFENIVKVTD